VLTLAEAAAYLRLPEAEVMRMVREQNLGARQVGSEWRFLKAGTPSLQANRWTCGHFYCGPTPGARERRWASRMPQATPTFSDSTRP
jgi:excisionase family DNA binding protein